MEDSQVLLLLLPDNFVCVSTIVSDRYLIVVDILYDNRSGVGVGDGLGDGDGLGEGEGDGLGDRVKLKD